MEDIKKMKTVWYVTPEEDKDGPNCTMDKIAILKQHLPAEVQEVICGMGQRHEDVAEALNYPVTAHRYTHIIGGPEYRTICHGQEVIMCADGKRQVFPNQYIDWLDLFPDGNKIFLYTVVANNTLLCGDTGFLHSLGYKDAQGGMAYEIELVQHYRYTHIRKVTEIAPDGRTRALLHSN